MLAAGFFSMFVWRRFLAPQPVMNSVSYNQAIAFIQQNKLIKQELGSSFQIMNCNGKRYPYKNDVKFDIVLYGTLQNGKVKIQSLFDKERSQWMLGQVELRTR